MSEPSEAYQNGPFIPGAAAYPPRWARDAEAFRARTRRAEGVSYGRHPREAFDLFLPDGAPDGLIIFIHGGYWKAFDRGDWSWLAEGAVAKNYAMAFVGYPLAPEARISQITGSVRRGIKAVASRVEGPIYLTGHSAGGHLSARMAMADGPRDVWPRIKRIVPISPLSDLRPFLSQPMNEVLRLDEVEAAQESPALHENASGIEVHTWVGGAERPAFLDQAKWLSEAWDGPLTVAPGKHHFDVIDDLKEGPLLDALIG